MPLASGYSYETVSANIGEMMRAGHARDSAIAASYAHARTAFFKRYPHGALPSWLAFPRKYRTREYYDRGGKPLHANPAPSPEIRRASRLYREFSGHRVTKALRVKTPDVRTALAIGPCLGIMYETVRDGVKERYLHKFSTVASRPLLAIASDGKTAMLLGGDFAFTDRGFEDNK